MRVLVAGEGAATNLIGGEHQHSVFDGDVRDGEAMARALEGVDALVLCVPRQRGEGWEAEFDLLDRATRGTYAALNAAVTAGVKRVVLVSTLALFERYPARWSVDESWRPAPDVERP